MAARQWHYASRERQEQFLSEAESWRGTPFRGRCAVKGRGADCVHLEIALHVACNAIAPVPPELIPAYSMDWHTHMDEPLLERWLWEMAPFRERLVKIDKAEPMMPGDVLLVKVGRVAHHLASYYEDGDALQTSQWQGGVARVPLWTARAPNGKPMIDYVEYVVRLLEKGAAT